MIYMCASKLLILIGRIMLPKEINAILNRVSEKRFFDCNLFCDGNRQKLRISSYRNMAILQILTQKRTL